MRSVQNSSGRACLWELDLYKLTFPSSDPVRAVVLSFALDARSLEPAPTGKQRRSGFPRNNTSAPADFIAIELFSPSSLKVPKPNLDSFVFLRVKERQENILVEPETDEQR